MEYLTTAEISNMVSFADLKVPGLVERLDLIDPSPENYWSKALPDIEKKINALPCVEETLFIGESENEE